MKLADLTFLAAAAVANAQTPVVIYPPAPSTTVISPLTTPTSQSNQALLNQINTTISQRRFEHQVLTLTSPTAPAVLINRPRVIRAR